MNNIIIYLYSNLYVCPSLQYQKRFKNVLSNLYVYFLINSLYIFHILFVNFLFSDPLYAIKLYLKCKINYMLLLWFNDIFPVNIRNKIILKM